MNNMNKEPQRVANLEGTMDTDLLPAAGKNVGSPDADDIEAKYLDGDNGVWKGKFIPPETEDEVNAKEKELHQHVQATLEEYQEVPAIATRREHARGYRAEPGTSLRVAIRQGAQVEEVERTDPKTGETRIYKVRNLDDPSAKTPRESRAESYMTNDALREEAVRRAVQSVDRLNS